MARLANRRGAAAALATLVFTTSCKSPPLGPAPYVPPPVGTVYRYSGFTNTVLAADGWRVRFADQKGREGLRVGVFITDDPKQPSTIDSAALAKLWPLRTGTQTIVLARRNRDVARWLFKVVGQQFVGVPAGTFQAYVVQAVVRPEELKDPRNQTTIGFTWWYAPTINAVVRFETTYFSGAATGHAVASSLEAVEAPGQVATSSTPLGARSPGRSARPAAQAATPP